MPITFYFSRKLKASTILTWILLPMLISLTTCGNKSELPTIKISDDFTGKVDLKYVHLVGPFLFDSTKCEETNTIDGDDLAIFNLKEDSLKEEDIINIKYKNAIDKNLLSKDFKTGVLEVPADNIDFIHLLDTAGTIRNESNFYLACNIESTSNQKIVFLTSTCFGIKVWLNNKLIQRENGELSFPKGFDHFMLLDLQKGNNLFVIKVSRGTNKLCWRLSSKIADLETAKAEYGINCFTDFISNPIITDNDSLEIYVGGYLKDELVDWFITNKFDKHHIFKFSNVKVDSFGYCKIPVTNLENDFYNFYYETRDAKFEELIYIGDMSKLIVHFENEIQQLRLNNHEDIVSLNNALERLKFLTNKKYRIKSRSEFKFRDKNIITTAFSIKSIIETAKQKKEPFLNKEGTYIKAFKSQIDATYQNYFFHASSEVLKKGKVPLVIILPFFHNPLSSMLKSWYLSNSDQIDWEKRLADENGFALMWPYLRGNSSTSPIAITDFFEVLKDVKQNYNIDPDRIFLMGDCLGATRSILIASKYPDLFAGISLFQAETGSLNDEHSPVNFIENLYNIPIYLYHSNKDEIVPVSNSDNFVKKAKNIGINYTYDRSNSDSHYMLPKNCHAPIFKFFKNKYRNQKPDTVYFKTFNRKYNNAYWMQIEEFIDNGKAEVEASINKKENAIYVNSSNISAYTLFLDKTSLEQSIPVKIYANNKLNYKGDFKDSIVVYLDSIRPTSISKNKFTEGPINQFFADEFTYILPQNGNFLTNMIEQEWGNKIFFKVKSISETSFDKTASNSNIILFGNNYKNPEIKVILSKLPVNYSESKLIFRGKEFNDKNLSICIIYPNPLNERKYVLYLNTSSPVTFNLINQNQILSGNTDYIIWDNSNGYIIDAGLFDKNWQ
jgi:dienelactone hydrolase